MERAQRDWLEGVLAAVGVLFLAVAALCVYAEVILVLHFRDSESAFPAGGGFVKTFKTFGLICFPVLGFAAFVVGWSFAGTWIRGLLRRIAGGPPAG